LGLTRGQGGLEKPYIDRKRAKFKKKTNKNSKKGKKAITEGTKKKTFLTGEGKGGRKGLSLRVRKVEEKGECGEVVREW